MIRLALVTGLSLARVIGTSQIGFVGMLGERSGSEGWKMMKKSGVLITIIHATSEPGSGVSGCMLKTDG